METAATGTRTLSPAAYEHAAECLRTMAHPHRLLMIHLLLDGRFTVGQLAQACGITSAATSGHLRLLSDRGLLKSHREGQQVFYEVAEQGLASILECVEKRFGQDEPANLDGHGVGQQQLHDDGSHGGSR